MSNTIKTRFCPSPTGLMHLGNTRTALFSALYSMNQKGDFLLRIEDTDKTRSKEEFVHQLMHDLQWLGLQWQEGPQQEKDNGPYYQSQRQGIYDGYYHHLIEKNIAYSCFCTEQQLVISRKIQLSQGKPPRYTGTCRSLSKEEVEQKIAAGLQPVLRFKVPQGHPIAFNDLVKGAQLFNSDDIGDFIIRRTDGTSPFMYCNAIDDALMGVTHVMRGEDHLTNTPRQIMILEALGLPVPQYAHFALIVGHDGSPLSKRHGSKSVHDLREHGYLPLAVTNYLGRLGHNYEDNQLLSLADLANKFDMGKLSKSPAKFDPHQLNHWQKEVVMSLSSEELWDWMGIQVHSIVPAEQQHLFVDTIRPNIEFPEQARQWAVKLFDEKLDYSDESIAILKATAPDFYDAFAQAIEEHGLSYQAICNSIKTNLSIKGKALFQPLRVILTDELHGPELEKIISLMGEELIAKRINHAKKIIG